MATNGQLIDITALLDARRVAREVCESPETRALYLETALPLPEAPAALARFVPAYCDPSNEIVGERFDRSLSTKEIAARIRADIKAATGTSIPKGTKVSVRFEGFSGGSAIRIAVTAVPAGFRILNEERVRFDVERPHDFVSEQECPRYKPAASALLRAISSIASAYNRNNSDSSVDYYDVNFYGGDARFDWRLERVERETLQAAFGAAVAS
jgi:hypothetical protein